MTKIGGSAFRDCKNLEEIVIPDTVTELGSYALYGCTNLQKVTLSKNATNLQGNMFERCASLESVIVPEGVTRIDGVAFSDCANLSSIRLPGSLNFIRSAIASNCPNLKDVYYNGTQEQWEKLRTTAYSAGFGSAKLHLAGESDQIHTVTFYPNAGTVSQNSMVPCPFLFALLLRLTDGTRWQAAGKKSPVTL